MSATAFAFANNSKKEDEPTTSISTLASNCRLPYPDIDYTQTSAQIDKVNSKLAEYDATNPDALNKTISGYLAAVDKAAAAELLAKSKGNIDPVRLQKFSHELFIKMNSCQAFLAQSNNEVKLSDYSTAYKKVMTANMHKFSEMMDSVGYDDYNNTKFKAAKGLIELIKGNDELYALMQGTPTIHDFEKFSKNYEIANNQSFGKQTDTKQCLVRDADKPYQIKALNISRLYPKAALKNHMSGDIYGLLDVDNHGNVTIKELNASDPIFLSENLRHNILSMKYRPAIKNCITYNSQSPLKIKFVVDK